MIWPQRLAGRLHNALRPFSRIGTARAPAPVRDDLWAVWPYDTFPFYLCGEVDRFTEDGHVHVKGYSGMVFRPVTILHGQQGEDFRAYLSAARTVYRDMGECLRNACGDRLIEACAAANVPPPKGAWRPGFRGYGMGEAFERGIAEIRKGNAPAHAYGHEVKGDPTP